MQDIQIFQICQQDFKSETSIQGVEVEVIALCHQVIQDPATWVNPFKECGSNNHSNLFNNQDQDRVNFQE
jgi:hypothetical protein